MTRKCFFCGAENSDSVICDDCRPLTDERRERLRTQINELEKVVFEPFAGSGGLAVAAIEGKLRGTKIG